MFPQSLLGITPQGWMRAWDDQGRVEHSAWPVPPALQGLPSNAILVLSIEDLGYSTEIIQHYVNLASVVVVTHERKAALVCETGDCSAVPAFAASMLDPTGAGDVFATALFVRYRETGDLLESARFAHAAAACNIEGAGVEAIPDRARVEERLAVYEVGSQNYEL
jgi:sugar/nucleoside kinase (ribokinase family)